MNDTISLNESCNSPVGSEKINKSTKIVINTARFTRSRDNPDFVAKQKSFMAQIQAANLGIPVGNSGTRNEAPPKRKRESTASPVTVKRRKTQSPDNTPQNLPVNDNACWDCHKEGQFICCEMCPRSFHLKCAGLDKEPEEDWACKECHMIMMAENGENRSRAMQLITVDQFGVLLKHALNRFKISPALAPFKNPVDIAEFPTYKDIVQHPVNLQTLEENIGKKFYGSTEAFLADAKWIVHNSVLFNGANSKITSLARSMIKTLKQELAEIETCPDCYLNAHQHPQTWFIEACRLAHPLVWARLKGFPFWPAKAVKYKEGLVDVRFFGRHDRSWIPLKDCYLFSTQMPVPIKSKNKTLESCLAEVNEHIEKLKEKFGVFEPAPHRTPFNPLDSEQIKLLLPSYEGPPIVKLRPANRVSSTSGQSCTDDDASSIASSDSTSSKQKDRRDSYIPNSPEVLPTVPEEDPHTKEKILPNQNILEQDRQSPIQISNVETTKPLVNEEDPPEVLEDEPQVSHSSDDVVEECFPDSLKALSSHESHDDDLLSADEGTPVVQQSNAAQLKITENLDDSYIKKIIEAKAKERQVDHQQEILDDDEEEIGASPVHEDTSTPVQLNPTPNHADEDDQTDIKEERTEEHMVVGKVEPGEVIVTEKPQEQLEEVDEENMVAEKIEEEEEEVDEENMVAEKVEEEEDEVGEDHMVAEAVENTGEDLEDVNEPAEETEQEQEEYMETQIDLPEDADGDHSEQMQQEENISNEAEKDPLHSSSEDEDDLMIDERPSELPEPSEETEKSEDIDENIRNLERLNALLMATDNKPDSPRQEPELTTETSENVEPEKSSARTSRRASSDDEFAGFSLDEVERSAKSARKISVEVDNLTKNKNITVTSSDATKETNHEAETVIQQSVSIRKVATLSQGTASNQEPENSAGTPERSVSDELQELSKSNSDISAIAGKIFHNITITSNKKRTEQKQKEKSPEGDSTKSDSLSQAARLVRNLGNVAVKRVDNKTIEHTSGNDKVTISVASESSEVIKPPRQKARKTSSSSTGSNASSAAKSEEDSVRMPSGVDTTRLSPSISITAVGNNNNTPEKIKRSPSFGSPPSTPSQAPTTSSTPASTVSTSVPIIPPPPLLQNPSISQAGGSRFFNPQMGGMPVPRSSVPPAGLRMLAANPAMMFQNRLPGNVVRHLPPDAGPLSAELNKHSMKLAEVMRITLEDLLTSLCNSGNLEAKLSALKLELERSNWRHQQELADMRHSADLLLVEMRTNMEAEKQRAMDEVRKQMEQKLSEVRRQYDQKLSERVNEVRRQADIEKQQEIEETKKKQWCAVCNKEALFFCCWNTSYCDYPCQQAHWPQHMTVCAQNNSNGTTQEASGDTNTNGDTSTQSSRVSTPVHSGSQSYQAIEDEEVRMSEERRRKRKRENPSPLFTEAMGRDQSPGNNCNPLPVTSPLGGSQVRPMISPGLNLGMLAGAANSQNMQMKLQRFLQPNMMQAQQPFFAAMDPRMMMMMGRNIPGSSMIRGPMQPFRPRYM